LKTTWDSSKELSSKQHSQTDIQELMIDIKHLKDKQDKADAFNNRIKNKNPSTFHYYLEQNYLPSSSSLVLNLFQPKKLLLQVHN